MNDPHYVTAVSAVAMTAELVSGAGAAFNYSIAI
jgi:hypothetical protein